MLLMKHLDLFVYSHTLDPDYVIRHEVLTEVIDCSTRASNGSTRSLCYPANILNSDLRTTSGDKSSFLSASLSFSAKTVSKNHIQSQQYSFVQQTLVHQKLF